MKILVIGSGGREHALCWKILDSKLVSEIFCAPGNGGTRDIVKNIDIASNDIDSLLEFAIENEIDLTIVGPEEALTLGIVDSFKEKNLKIFGPDKKAARLEGSKEFSKKIMDKYNIPTAKYKCFTDFNEAKRSLKNFNYPLVIKADGLCLGKGVYILHNEEEALEVLKDILEDKCFGDQGQKVIIEEFLEGLESSLLCFVSGDKVIPMDSAKDYKKNGNGDIGLNTGGIGSYSPNDTVTSELESKIRKDILVKISKALREEKLEYEGILFIGFMINGDNINVLEFNVRFGDPETQAVIVRLESDLLDIILKSINGSLKEDDLIWKEEHSVCIVTTSIGYPLEYEKGFPIEGLKNIDDSSLIVFHNNTKNMDEKLYTDGGRVLTLCALGKNKDVARGRAYLEVDKIKYKNIYFRDDIGKY